MSRSIDRWPEPTQKCDPKVIVLSRSRMGTFSLYQAFRMLGYKPYHMYEAVKHGKKHLDVAKEAVAFKYNGDERAYGKAEFDKWLAGYDVIIEVPQFFVEQFVEYYPNAKFMLTERDLDAWLRSMDGSVGDLCVDLKRPPMSIMRKMDDFVDSFATATEGWAEAFYGGKGCTPEGREWARQRTHEIQETVKSIVPKDKLLVCKLEDGFGWEEICPFLGCDIPKEKYPIGNAPAEFQKLIESFMTPRIRIMVGKVATGILVPAIALGAWYYIRRR